jgi:hypothetical protein
VLGLLLVVLTVVFVAGWVARYVAAQSMGPAERPPVDLGPESVYTPEQTARTVARLFAMVMRAEREPCVDEVREMADVFDVRLKPGQQVAWAMRDDLERTLEELGRASKKAGGAVKVLEAECAKASQLDDEQRVAVIKGLYRLASAGGPLAAKQRKAIDDIAARLSVAPEAQTKAEQEAQRGC